jgi:hypothetical protein
MKKYFPYIMVVVLVVLLLLSIQRCTYNRTLGSGNAAALTDTVAYFTNKLGTQTASIKTLLADKQQLASLILAKDKQLSALASEFANVHAVVKYKTVTAVDTVYIAYARPLDTLPAFERNGAVFNPWYSFDYKVKNNGLNLANLTMQTETAVITGVKRNWFLGKETLVTDVTNTNPYVTVTNLKAAEVTLPVPWYKKWYVWLAAGAVGGFLMAK